MIKQLLIMAVVFASGLHTNGCTNSMAAVPDELLGISIGMQRDAAEAQLNRIGKLERSEDGRQEVWRLDNDARFSTLALGFDKAERVRYVTAFVDKAKATERLAFSSVGDLSKARAEITGQHHRYTWTLESKGYDINAYGDDPQFLTMFTLAKRTADGEQAGEEEDDD